jgi:hypothetical protein
MQLIQLCVSLQVMLAAVVVAQSDRYPAGVHPGVCPNYPYCNSASYYSYVPHVAAASHNYPAGVSPSSCPNYPYCSHYVPVAPLPGHHSQKYPAGVSAAACPNYPFCH